MTPRSTIVHPKRIYVYLGYGEKSSDQDPYLIAVRNFGELPDDAITGVYVLEEVKKLTVTRELK